MKRILIYLVRLYQKFISPGLGSNCRFHPTCSQYMIDAITIHGAFKGTIMGISRILRCQPFCRGGIDYVPKKFSLKRNPDHEYHGPYDQ